MTIKFNLFIALLFSFGATAQTPIEPSWTLLSHASNTDSPSDFWVNPAGESYMFGQISSLSGSPALDGMMLIKANADGTEMWRQHFHPQSNDWQFFSSSVVGDENGNVYLIYTDDFRYTDLNSTRIAVKKLDAQGNLIWENHYTDVIENLVESPHRRSGVYKNGTLYFVSGTGGLNPSDDADAMIVRINAASGALIDKLVFDSQYQTDDMFRQVKVADNGDMWAIGRSRGYMYSGGIYSHYDSNIVKYNAAGQFQWEHRENGTGNSEDFGINMAIDADGNAYTSSQLRMLGINQKRVQIQKLSPAGTVLWTYWYQGSSSGYIHDQPIDILPNGNIVFSASNENGIVTKAINGQTGTEIWSQNYNRSEAGASNRPYDMKVSPAGNVVVTGVSRDNTPFGAGWDFLTMSYSMNGNPQWISNYNRGNYATMGDWGLGIEFDAAGNVYAFGDSQLGEEANYDSDFVLLKFGNSLVIPANDVSANLCLYPNPAADVAYIRGLESENASITISDLNGRTIQSLPHVVSSDEIRLDISGLQSGLYLVTVKTDSGNSTLKIQKS